MSGLSIPLSLYVRLADTGSNWNLHPADIPAWEICRQEIRQAGDQIDLTERVVLSGLTLRGAWSAIVVLKENQV